MTPLTNTDVEPCCSTGVKEGINWLNSCCSKQYISSATGHTGYSDPSGDFAQCCLRIYAKDHSYFGTQPDCCTALGIGEDGRRSGDSTYYADCANKCAVASTYGNGAVPYNYSSDAADCCNSNPSNGIGLADSNWYTYCCGMKASNGDQWQYRGTDYYEASNKKCCPIRKVTSTGVWAYVPSYMANACNDAAGIVDKCSSYYDPAKGFYCGETDVCMNWANGGSAPSNDNDKRNCCQNNDTIYQQNKETCCTLSTSVYNSHKSECCGYGTVYNSHKSECCGYGTVYNSHKSDCCSIGDIFNSHQTDCCSIENIFNNHQSDCCNSSQSVFNDNKSTCCGIGPVFNSNKTSCCNYYYNQGNLSYKDTCCQDSSFNSAHSGSGDWCAPACSSTPSAGDVSETCCKKWGYQTLANPNYSSVAASCCAISGFWDSLDTAGKGFCCSKYYRNACGCNCSYTAKIEKWQYPSSPQRCSSTPGTTYKLYYTTTAEPPAGLSGSCTCEGSVGLWSVTIPYSYTYFNGTGGGGCGNGFSSGTSSTGLNSNMNITNYYVKDFADHVVPNGFAPAASSTSQSLPNCTWYVNSTNITTPIIKSGTCGGMGNIWGCDSYSCTYTWSRAASF